MSQRSCLRSPCNTFLPYISHSLPWRVLPEFQPQVVRVLCSACCNAFKAAHEALTM
jgi:hypothetical protein